MLTDPDDIEAAVTAAGQAGEDIAAVYENVDPDGYPPLPDPEEDPTDVVPPT